MSRTSTVRPKDADRQRYADEVQTSDGNFVRLTQVNPDKILRIGPDRRAVRAGDIPMTAGRTTCGSIVRGIAFQKGNVIFCEEHHDTEFVEEIVS